MSDVAERYWQARDKMLADAKDATIEALQAELAAYKAQPFVPRSEYDRVCEARDAALALLDTWAGALSAQEYLSARNTLLADSLKALVRQLEKIGGYSTPEQQSELRCARAVLVEGSR